MAFAINRILTSHHDFTPDEYELKLRFVLFNALILFNAACAGLGMIYRFVTLQFIHAAIDLIYVLLALTVFFLARRSKASLSTLMWFVIFFSFVIVSILFYRGLNPLIGISWYVLILLVSYVFKGDHASLAIFVLSLAVIFSVSLFQRSLPLADILLGLLPYGSIMLFFYLFYRYNETLKEDMEEQKVRLTRLAHFDSLTEIPNRNALLTYFRDALACLSKSDTMLAVLFIDLDDFKRVNDRYGHAIGDGVLRIIVERLRRQIRDTDLLARHGGDEFVIVVHPIKGQQDIEKIITHIFQAIRKPIVHEERTISITLSIGITLAPQDGTHSIQLLNQADQAMYHAKNKGKNTYSYFSEDVTKSSGVNTRS